QVVFAPNPLNPQSKLSFTTEREGPARALLFDIHGRLVRTILDKTRLPVGTHEFTFDGKTDRGAAISSGVYFYRVESTAGRSEGQIVILK
ncbi:MAG TPA: FlgD immunoglobulin-like domain containing protein, partial [Candidatus Binatia bacterium]|nr:FlgD immunoglobulin-like domain containing protein [Candidatus Binatia bacterium]